MHTRCFTHTSLRFVGSQFVPLDAESDAYDVPWRCDRSLSGNNCMLLGILYEAMMRWVGPAKTVTIRAMCVVLRRC
jgi:hypothetical protein